MRTFAYPLTQKWVDKFVLMTFEEFFKKKKISLPLLLDAEPVLFAEFESHFAQMGEKSFDHTKKYWFNQLRRRFPLPAEVKAEKVTIANPLAEQTITEALTETVERVQSVGFKPRFKAAAVPGPAEKQPEETALQNNDKPAETTAAPAVGFKPRFKAAVTAKPEEEKPEEKPAVETSPASEEAKPAVGFKPRFKATTVEKPVEEKKEDTPAGDTSPASEEPRPAVGFKPRFKASVMAKPAEEKTEEPPAAAEPRPASEEAKPVVGFKPRFNKNINKTEGPGGGQAE